MYWLGRLVLALGYGKVEVLVGARVLSATLAGLVIVLTYLIARRAGGSIVVAALSGLFLLCVSEMVHNGHFAHNDTYVMFFTTLSILMLLQYHHRGHRGWLYAAFLTTGMAASSKYIGGSLLLAPLAYYLFCQQKKFPHAALFHPGDTFYRCRRDLFGICHRHTQGIVLDDLLFQARLHLPWDGRSTMGISRELCAVRSGSTRFC